jgi:hypothetical protein
LDFVIFPQVALDSPPDWRFILYFGYVSRSIVNGKDRPEKGI